MKAFIRSASNHCRCLTYQDEPEMSARGYALHSVCPQLSFFSTYPVLEPQCPWRRAARSVCDRIRRRRPRVWVDSWLREEPAPSFLDAADGTLRTQNASATNISLFQPISVGGLSELSSRICRRAERQIPFVAFQWPTSYAVLRRICIKIFFSKKSKVKKLEIWFAISFGPDSVYCGKNGWYRCGLKIC